jgi:parallel beta-helix repeat protein
VLKPAISALALAACFQAGAAARQIDIRSIGAKCDGRTDDAPKVQAALNRLAPRDVLLVSCRAGIGSSGLVLRDRRDVAVRGVNGGGFKALAPASLASQGFSPVMFLVQRCVRCAIESLYFEMNGTPEAAIGLDRCSDSALRGNIVADTGYPASAAIVATGNRHGVYAANQVLRTAHDAKDGTRGMWIGNGDETQEELRPEVSGNRVEDAGATGIVVYGRGAVVSGNAVARTKGAGIKLIARELPGAGPGPHSRIADNTVTGNLFHGIQIERAEGGVRIDRNTLDSNAIAGLYVYGGYFSGDIVDNTFAGNREAGIYLYCASDVTIRNNRFDGGSSSAQQHGILLEAIAGNSIRSVAISGNAIWDQASAGIAVWARGGILAGLKIEGNSFGGRTPAGVRIEDRANQTAGQISLAANCFDRQLARTVADQRASALPAPAASTCPQGRSSIAKKEGRPE